MVLGAKMQLRHDYQDRFIKVDAVETAGACQKSVIAVLAVIGIDGGWPEVVSIGTLAAIDGLDDNRWDTPIMYGRETVPLDSLADHLRATIQEREQVAMARKQGIKGPHQFAASRWE